MCAACGRITAPQAAAGLRPWGWVARQWRLRHPEAALTPSQVKGIHDRAIRRLRGLIADDPALGEVLLKLLSGDPDV